MIDPKLKQSMTEGLERYLNDNDNRPVNQQLRPHQIDALQDVVDHLKKDKFPPPDEAAAPGMGKPYYEGGSIEMATGLGKTYAQLATVIGAALSTGQKAVIITPRIRLNTQFADTYIKKKGLNPKDIAIYDSTRDGEERSRAIDGANVIITTDEGFRLLTERGIISPEPKTSDGKDNPAYRPLILADEADMFMGYETANSLRRYVANSMVLTWTATNYGVDSELFKG